MAQREQVGDGDTEAPGTLEPVMFLQKSIPLGRRPQFDHACPVSPVRQVDEILATIERAQVPQAQGMDCGEFHRGPILRVEAAAPCVLGPIGGRLDRRDPDC